MYTLWLETASEAGEIFTGGTEYILDLFHRLVGAKFIVHQCGHVPALMNVDGVQTLRCLHCNEGESDDR